MLPKYFNSSFHLQQSLGRPYPPGMKQSTFIRIIQGGNTIETFRDEQAEKDKNKHKISDSCLSLCILGIVLAIGLSGCLGPSKDALKQQFDATIGQDKDRLITELGLPRSECTPLKFGEACEWVQVGGPPFLEGPLEGTFPGDSLTYFLDSRRIVCQWRFLGRNSGTQHSASQC